jgi:hypothetical protein
MVGKRRQKITDADLAGFGAGIPGGEWVEKTEECFDMLSIDGNCSVILFPAPFILSKDSEEFSARTKSQGVHHDLHS